MRQSPSAVRATMSRRSGSHVVASAPYPRSGSASARSRTVRIPDSSSVSRMSTRDRDRSGETMEKDGFIVVVPISVMTPFST